MSRDGERGANRRPARATVELDEGPGLPEARWHAPEQIGFPVARVAPPVAGRGLTVAAGVVALVVGLAVLKPWGPDPGRQPAVAPAPPALATEPPPPAPPAPRPTADLSPEGVAGPVCLGPSGWRIASLETWRDRDVRVWRAIEPLAGATGPLDPAIPTVPVVGFEIEALGWCAPAFGPGRPGGPERVAGWAVVNGVAQALELRRVLPESGTTHLAALYVPRSPCLPQDPCPSTEPGEPGASDQPWAPGRIVFRYEDIGSGAVLWLGADIVLYDVALPAAPSPVSAEVLPAP